MSTIPGVKATIVVIGSSSEPNVAALGGSALFPFLEGFVDGIVNSPFIDAMQNAGYAVGAAILTARRSWIPRCSARQHGD